MDEAKVAAQAAATAESIDPASFMQVGAGYEGMSAAQFSPMYLRIVHSDSKILMRGMPEYVPGVEFGDFYNDLTGRGYGKSIDVIPLRSDILWFEYHPTKIGDFKGIHAPMSIPTYGDEYKGLFVAEGEGAGNRIVPTHVFYLLLLAELEAGNKNIGIFSLHKTGIPHAKVWNTRIRQTMIPRYKNGEPVLGPDGKPLMGEAPYYSSVWRLTSAMNQNDSGQTWYTIGNGKATNAERLRFLGRQDYEGVAIPSRTQIDSDKGAMQAAIAQGEQQRQITDGAVEPSEF